MEFKLVKPKLTIEQQIEHLKTKGVLFEKCPEEKAADYLRNKGNYFHVAAYRTLFQKHHEGKSCGQYVHLEFDDLIDLTELDNLLRQTFLPITLDVEHFSKMKVIQVITDRPEEDGFSVVEDFLASLKKGYRERIARDLDVRSNHENAGRDLYAGDLIAKYHARMPVWVFLEVVPFGTYLSFYKFCAERWNDKDMLVEHYLLKQVKSVRNASAHGSCIINGFTGAAKSSIRTSQLIYESLNAGGIKNTKARKAKLQNPRMQQLVTTLFSFHTFVKNKDSQEKPRVSLTAFRIKLSSSAERYGEENTFVSYLSFLSEIIDFWS